MNSNRDHASIEKGNNLSRRSHSDSSMQRPGSRLPTPEQSRSPLSHTLREDIDPRKTFARKCRRTRAAVSRGGVRLDEAFLRKNDSAVGDKIIACVCANGGEVEEILSAIESFESTAFSGRCAELF